MTPARALRDHPRIVDAVLAATTSPARRRVLALSVVAALLAHGALLWVVLRTQDSLEPWAASLAVRIHAELGKETLVELAPPPPPPPPPRDPPRAPPPDRIAGPPREVRPPPPAQAGQVLAQLPGPSAPLDLTQDTFVTGTASTYAGGLTSPTGTSTTAVEARVVDPTAPRPEVDLSRTVALEDDDWHCPWPASAESADVDRAEAVVRVEVSADGSPSNARVVRDPGMGFGAAAVGCALRARYQPARDRLGVAVATLSPPIRVRFTR